MYNASGGLRLCDRQRESLGALSDSIRRDNSLAWKETRKRQRATRKPRQSRLIVFSV